jgi:AcrR family transcriptional regulator
MGASLPRNLLASATLDALDPRSARSIRRILDAAAKLFGAEGYQRASMTAVARAAGVSKGLLHYHFRSKEHLLLEAQRATFRAIHARFQDRFKRGERGTRTALEGLDALWAAIWDMRRWAPFMVETISLAAQQSPVRQHVDRFHAETQPLLEQGIRDAFADQLDQLVVPPERLALLIRTALHGLVVELALARTPSEFETVERSYRDMRALFERVVASGQHFEEPT